MVHVSVKRAQQSLHQAQLLPEHGFAACSLLKLPGDPCLPWVFLSPACRSPRYCQRQNRRFGAFYLAFSCSFALCISRFPVWDRAVSKLRWGRNWAQLLSGFSLFWSSCVCRFHAGLLYFVAGNDIPAPKNRIERIEVGTFAEMSSQLPSIPVLAFFLHSIRKCFIFLWHW